jgi:hypothetical protein
MRPGCDRAATARLTYDPVACELWLDPLSGSRAAVQELCDFHVERLTVPRGWTVTDRRTDGATSPPAPAGRRPADVTVDVTDTLTADAPGGAADVPDVPEEAAVDDVVEDTEADADTDVDVVGVIGEKDAADDTEDAEVAAVEADADGDAGPASGDGPPSSSLLGRAFAWTGPQHSVLTTPGASSESEASPARE